MLTRSEQDNLLRWDGKREGFYEVYYMTANDPLRGLAFWLRYTLLIPQKGAGESEAAVWAAFFDADQPTNNMILKDVFAPSSCDLGGENVHLNIGGSEFFNSGARGRIAKGHKSIEWSLNWRPAEDGYRYYPDILYKTPFPSTKVTSPNPSVAASGQIIVCGQPFTLDAIPLHQGHIWGSGYARSWAWSHCNSYLEDGAAVFSALSAKVNGCVPKATLINVRTSRGEYRLDRVRCWLTNRSDISLTGWAFEGRCGEYFIRGTVNAKPSDLIGVSYRSPDGSSRFCYNTELADSTIEIFRLEGKDMHLFQTLRSRRTTAFETVSKEPDANIPVYL